MVTAASGPVHRRWFFIPTGDGQAGERTYQQLRQQIEAQMGRAAEPASHHGALDSPGQPRLRDGGRRA